MFFYSERTRKAYTIATEAHWSQVDKSGFPYILHLTQVASMAKTEDECIVGILHDILEDVSWNYLSTIRSLFGDVIADAVEAISRKKDEVYRDYICRCKENLLARKVKLYDLNHNMNDDRLAMNPSLGSLRKRFMMAIDILREGTEDFSESISDDFKNMNREFSRLLPTTATMNANSCLLSGNVERASKYIFWNKLAKDDFERYIPRHHMADEALIDKAFKMAYLP